MAIEPIDETQGNLYLELCMQVGHLFLSFANLEGVLTSILKLHMAENLESNESNPTGIKLASAVYGGLRFTQARDIMKRIIATEVPPSEKVDFLTGIFAQIGHVQAFRDMLAHQSLQRSTERIDGTWRLSNMFTTKDVTRPLVYEFTLEAVNAASSDLMKATKRLGGQPVTTNLVDSAVGDLSPIPWRYKPSLLKLVPRSQLNFPQSPGP